MKDELLASRAAELQRSQELQQHGIETAGSDKAEACSSKRQRLHDSSVSPLDKDVILDRVFRFVEGGDHLYFGGVSRRWRGRYLRHCVQNAAFMNEGKCVTRHRSALMTESRLQLALSNGLTVKDWTFATRTQAKLICYHCLEPERVMALLRVLGVPWSTDLCYHAAGYDKLALLQW
jgi:hypothetical protein